MTSTLTKEGFINRGFNEALNSVKKKEKIERIPFFNLFFLLSELSVSSFESTATFKMIETVMLF